jgi:hypothetical protein
MNAIVTIELSMESQAKHRDRTDAVGGHALTDNPDIGRGFWQVDNYNNSSIDLDPLRRGNNSEASVKPVAKRAQRG